jgi:hypothetical protein
MSKSSSVIVSGVVIVVLAAVATGYTYYKDAEAEKESLRSEVAQLKAQPTSTPSDAPLATATPSASPATTPTSNSVTTYKSTTYGFQITLGRGWESHKIVETSTSNRKASDPLATVAFHIPTTQANYPSQSLPGYVQPMMISIYTPASWAEAEKDASHPTLIQKTNTYVYAYTSWQDAPQDVLDRLAGMTITTEALATFKLL